MILALISGTSGLVGMQLLHQLLKNPSYVYVLSVGRRKLALKHEKLIQLDGEMQVLSSWDWEEKINAQALRGEYQGLVAAIKEKKVDIHSQFLRLGRHSFE